MTHIFFFNFSFQEASVFVFDKRSVEKLYRSSKRRDQVTEALKVGLGHLQCFRYERATKLLFLSEIR